MSDDNLKRLAEYEYCSGIDCHHSQCYNTNDMSEIIRCVKDLLKTKLNRFEDSIQYAIESKFEDDLRKNKSIDKKINDLNNNIIRIEKMVLALQETVESAKLTQHI